MKYDFDRAYPGPLGAHLGQLSAYTRSRKDEDRLRGESIHPRNRSSTPNSKREKRNTCAAPKPETREKLRAALAAHVERHPHDKLSEGRLASL